MYEAEVISVDDSAGTCYVRYVDYGNEEEHSIKDLLRVHRQKHRHLRESENEVKQQRYFFYLQSELVRVL